MLDKSIRVQKQKYLDANLSGADVDTAEGRAYQLQLKMAQEECRFLAEGGKNHQMILSSHNQTHYHSHV